MRRRRLSPTASDQIAKESLGCEGSCSEEYWVEGLSWSKEIKGEEVGIGTVRHKIARGEESR